MKKPDHSTIHHRVRHAGRLSGQRGFTLIELLVSIGILIFLAILGASAMQSALGSASKTREVNAGKQLVQALQTSAADNNGIYLAGMDHRAGTAQNPVLKADGKRVTGRAAQRYPFRLAQYLGDQFEGTILVNHNVADIRKQAERSPNMYDYFVSTYPALGMNIFCVGGVVRANGTIMHETACISRVANARGSVLAFASGGSGTGANKMQGFSYVTPPTKQHDSPICERWQSPAQWTEKSDPMKYGWVDFRYDGKAVCAFLDGTVRMCGPEELSDMRLWTHAALDANDPHYELGQ